MNPAAPLPAAILLLDYPAAWPLVCLALVGIGAAVRDRLGGDPDGGDGLDRLPRDGWLGWGVTVGCLQAWHLFRPVDEAALALLVVTGWALLVRRAWRSRPVRVPWGWGLALVLLAGWLASPWTFRSLAIDTGLYHLGAVRWAREYPLVPGLGLLHERLAFNNSSFLWAALCEHWPGGMERAAAGAEILFFLALANALLGARRALAPGRAARPRDWFDAFSLVPLLVVTLEDFRYDGPLSPDLVLFPLGLAVVSEVLGLLDRPAAARAAPVLLLSACAATVKLSYAGAAAGAWLVTLWLLRGDRQTWVLAAGLAVWIGGTWSLRSVLLSGWPLFPVPAAGLPVPWRLPAEEVAAVGGTIRAWALAPGGASRGPGDWLRELAVQRFAVGVPLLLVVLGAVAVAAGGRRPGRLWAALVPPAAGLAVWVMAAPLVRFASSLPWALGLAALAVGWGEGPRWRGLGVALLAALAVGLVDPWAYATSVRNGPPRIPFAELEIRHTDSGLSVLVPAEGDQCWDAPLPHAPRLDPRLALRDPDDLRAGFRRSAR